MIIYTNGSDRVIFKSYKPTEKQKEKGIEVSREDIPKEVNKKGKDAFLHYDKNKNEFYYEYEDRELTSEEKIKELKEDNEDIMLALAEMAEGV